MNSLLNTLLRASISASMSDREAFTQRVTAIIEQKMEADPQVAAKLSENVAAMMESIDENLLVEELLKPQQKSNRELEQKIDKLTQAIERLNLNLEKQWK